MQYLANWRMQLAANLLRSTHAKYGHCYLAEFQYRFNRRFHLKALLRRLEIAVVQCRPCPERVIRAAEVRTQSGAAMSLLLGGEGVPLPEASPTVSGNAVAVVWKAGMTVARGRQCTLHCDERASLSNCPVSSWRALFHALAKPLRRCRKGHDSYPLGHDCRPYIRTPFRKRGCATQVTRVALDSR